MGKVKYEVVELNKPSDEALDNFHSAIYDLIIRDIHDKVEVNNKDKAS